MLNNIYMIIKRIIDLLLAFFLLIIACVLEMLKCVWGKTCPDSLFKIVTPDDIGEGAAYLRRTVQVGVVQSLCCV